ncbi:hypothetical protein QE152_g26950 [Popillia japonica]|uniref:Uncharacterized protein n=1 Tax=Popillia japonica TaxID=7064 RepID=A0AAW1JV36_POPJA
MYLETCGYQVHSSRSVVTWCIARCYQEFHFMVEWALLSSRRVSPDVIKNSTLWWNGPCFLQGDETTWPRSDFPNSTLPELKKTVQAFVSIDPEPFPMTNFSSYSRLRRVTAYCFRFAKNSALACHDRASGPLISEELQSASTSLLKIAQSQCFPDELKTLTKSLSQKNFNQLLHLY